MWYTTLVDGVYLQERITKVKALITVYEDAILAIVTNGAQSYTLDTGQSRQTVTKVDVPDMETALKSLYNLLATLEARLNGSGVTTVRPAW